MTLNIYISRQGGGSSRVVSMFKPTPNTISSWDIGDGLRVHVECFDECARSFEGSAMDKAYYEAKVAELEAVIRGIYEQAGHAIDMPTQECEHD